MRVRFLVGPSGSGKTFACLAEIRAALKRSPEGPPLLFLTPRQGTFQVERQILSDPSLHGYTRLRILSFEQLAEYIVTQLTRVPPRLLSQEGRLMALRALLSRHREDLRLFRATARLRGFAQQLSVILKELQRSGVSPAELEERARQAAPDSAFSHKLHDLAFLLQAYLNWLDEHGLHDEDRLVEMAADALRHGNAPGAEAFRLDGLWLDGFAEIAKPQMELLAAVLPRSREAALAFNLDRPSRPGSWLSAWAPVEQTFSHLRSRLAGIPGMELTEEWLERDPARSRFARQPLLRHLERHWARPVPWEGADDDRAVRVAACANPEAEAMLAAREILQFVRRGGRFREAAVLARSLEEYHGPIRRVFAAYGIPVFLDRREPVGHHPLAELTRSALRVIAWRWQREDWFGALKTGLAHGSDAEIDRLENEALARGWKGAQWLEPLRIENDAKVEWAEPLRQRLVQPFVELQGALESESGRVNGPQLAEAIRGLWSALGVLEKLQAWSEAEPRRADGTPNPSLHLTFWEQMQGWLENLELAFATDAMTLREWLPVLEAGLSSQTVGVIPPTVDQVMAGGIERSRSPEARLCVLLGWNETVFPALPKTPALLTEPDRALLSSMGTELISSFKAQLARERYLAYIACTRASERVVICHSRRDADGDPLNPSPFLGHLQSLFPALKIEEFAPPQTWAESEHESELIDALLRPGSGLSLSGWPRLEQLPAVEDLRQRAARFPLYNASEGIAPALAERLHGKTLATSVSGLEEFAACPFRFFVHSGLKAEERRQFELDAKELGTFQHEALAKFHLELAAEAKRWRDLTPQEARERMGQAALSLAAKHRDGLFDATDESRFAAKNLAASLQDFIETIVGWMPQYEFDPVAVELAFGVEERPPLDPWLLDLGEGHGLAFRGKMDRIDVWKKPGADEALCVVMDYKSSARKIDSLLARHGIQLQLPAYLNVLRAVPDGTKLFGARKLIPAGVFYVNLRGARSAAPNRSHALASAAEARKLAYQHSGRFDANALPHLDRRPKVEKGDQFNYRRNKDGSLRRGGTEPMEAADFTALLDRVETLLKEMGRAIYAGNAAVDPYQKGSSETACDKCDYASICRIDRWRHSFRVLKEEEAACAED